MAHYQYGGDEESAELKKHNAEVVRMSSSIFAVRADTTA